VNFRFTDEQWKAVRSARKWTGPDHVIDWEEVRVKIEEAGREALQLRHNRSYLGSPVEIRNSLRKVLRLRRELQAAMNVLPEAIRGSRPEPNLEEQDRRLQSWLDRYEEIAGPAFRGRKDPVRSWLEMRLLTCWIGYLEGELSFSRKIDGTPCGPLVDFLTLTLQAIVGSAPGPDGIAKIIDYYRKTPSLPD
jgi:hypothetical protein